jgi:hypothetical protein
MSMIVLYGMHPISVAEEYGPLLKLRQGEAITRPVSGQAAVEALMLVVVEWLPAASYALTPTV